MEPNTCSTSRHEYNLCIALQIRHCKTGTIPSRNQRDLCSRLTKICDSLCHLSCPDDQGDPRISNLSTHMHPNFVLPAFTTPVIPMMAFTALSLWGLQESASDEHGVREVRPRHSSDMILDVYTWGVFGVYSANGFWLPLSQLLCSPWWHSLTAFTLRFATNRSRRNVLSAEVEYNFTCSSLEHRLAIRIR